MKGYFNVVYDIQDNFLRDQKFDLKKMVLLMASRCFCFPGTTKSKERLENVVFFRRLLSLCNLDLPTSEIMRLWLGKKIINCTDIFPDPHCAAEWRPLESKHVSDFIYFNVFGLLSAFLPLSLHPHPPTLITDIFTTTSTTSTDLLGLHIWHHSLTFVLQWYLVEKCLYCFLMLQSLMGSWFRKNLQSLQKWCIIFSL